MRPEFSCSECGSQSVIYPEILEESALVLCAGCRATLGTLGELRQIAEGSLTERATNGLSRRIR
jgi:hypothetical protein